MKRHRFSLAAPILGLAIVLAQPSAAATPVTGSAAGPGEEVGAVQSTPGAIVDPGFGAFELSEIAFPSIDFAAMNGPFADASGAVVMALPGGALASIAGREDVTQVVNSRNAATVANNSVGNNSQTGQVKIADNAFENLSGLSVININTGNNVAVNAAINVNISLTGPQ